jgi:hypothetical protein
MSPRRKKDILYIQRGAWRILNRAAQEKMNRLLKAVITATIPEITGEGATLLLEPIHDSNFRLDAFELTQKEQIDVLMGANILPKNFYQL